jgi:hypothetical protein
MVAIAVSAWPYSRGERASYSGKADPKIALVCDIPAAEDTAIAITASECDEWSADAGGLDAEGAVTSTGTSGGDRLTLPGATGALPPIGLLGGSTLILPGGPSGNAVAPTGIMRRLKAKLLAVVDLLPATHASARTCLCQLSPAVLPADHGRIGGSATSQQQTCKH